MKKIWLAILAVVITLGIRGCSKEPEKKEEGNDNPLVIVSDGRKQDNKAQEENPFDEPVDIDISESSGTIVYSTVYDMMWNPENYVGKKIRITGYFALGEDQHGRQLFGCIVPDATACCSQGIEFVLKNDRKYPDDYPKPGQWMILQGEFTYYDEDNIIRNLALINADMKLAAKQGYVN